MRYLLTFAAFSCAFANPIFATTRHAAHWNVPLGGRGDSDPRKTISFTPQDEYTLSKEYDLGDTESLFEVTPLTPSQCAGKHDESDTRCSDRLFSSSGSSPAVNTKATPISLQAIPTTIWRPRSREAYQKARLRSQRDKESEVVEWEEVEVYGPDVQDGYTIAQLARMTGNAYALPGWSNWYDVDIQWNTVSIVVVSLDHVVYQHLFTELPVWLGRYSGWLPRTCLSLF